MNGALEGKKVAIFVADGFEQVELTEPREPLNEAGAPTGVVSRWERKVRGAEHGKTGRSVKVDVSLNEAKVSDYGALLRPGGVMNPDTLRMDQRAVEFVRGFLWALATGCGILATNPALAAFEGPYALTPPPPGVYTNSEAPANFGRWGVDGRFNTINTANAPHRLVLEVPSHSLVANSLTFTNSATTDGTVSFNCATISPSTNHIFWIRQPGGTNDIISIPLDLDPPGPLHYFEFEIKAGDRFGFRLNSGGDVINPGDPEMLTLTVENFGGPLGPLPGLRLFMPSPGVILWQGETNLTYSVQASTDLSGTNWAEVGTATSATTNFAFTNSATAPQQFFRVAWP